jgi:nuclear cap-binding protein subunit 2
VSTTLYVGNLSFFTLESQLLEVFSQSGQVVNLIMGLNKVKMQPCGFCFVEYATRSEARLAVDTLNRSTLDGRTIRVDWDYGFEP